MKKIQETPEYIIVKRATDPELKRTLKRIVMQGALFVAAIYGWMYLLVFLIF
jgi:hypothetical protein